MQAMLNEPRIRCVSLLLLLTMVIALFPFAAPVAAQEQPIDQMRAFWVDSSNPGFLDPQQVDELIDNVVRANANTIIVQMRRHGDSWYNRSLEPRAAHRGLAPAEWYDPLDYLLQRAHAHGVKVHAWLVISVACRERDALRWHPQHVCATHGPSAPDPERWTTATYNGTQVGDLDFGHPSAVHYMESVVQHLLANYPTVDGIHYDFVRYSDVSYGYNQISLDRFRAAHGLPGSYRPHPNDWLWGQWRRDRMTELVRRMYIKIKAFNPHIQVSAATITWGGIGSYTPDDWPNSAAYGRVFQDWAAWLNEGIIDFAVPMHYFADGQPRHREWYDGWINWDRWNTGRRAIVAGTGAWLNSPEQGISQIQRALAPDAEGRTLSGVALYNYHQPFANSNPQWRREYMDTLRNTVFAQPARAPEWHWIVNPTTGHLQGMAAVDGELVPHAKVSLIRDGAWIGDITASIDGWYGSVDLEPGTYTLVIHHPDGRTAQLDGVVVQPGQVTST